MKYYHFFRLLLLPIIIIPHLFLGVIATPILLAVFVFDSIALACGLKNTTFFLDDTITFYEAIMRFLTVCFFSIYTAIKGGYEWVVKGRFNI